MKYMNASRYHFFKFLIVNIKPHPLLDAINFQNTFKFLIVNIKRTTDGQPYELLITLNSS